MGPSPGGAVTDTLVPAGWRSSSTQRFASIWLPSGSRAIADRRRDAFEHELELGGAGLSPVLARQEDRLHALAVGEVPEDDLDGDLVPVREGGGDDLHVAHLAVEPDNPLLEERWPGRRRWRRSARG